MGDMDTVIEVLSTAGLNAPAILASTQDGEVKAKLISNTQEAVERGLFGAPTMFVDGEMFFGQDRLQFVEAALQ
jgi:2-hydroxychromene-2-carboxylate isomerase